MREFLQFDLQPVFDGVGVWTFTLPIQVIPARVESICFDYISDPLTAAPVAFLRFDYAGVSLVFQSMININGTGSSSKIVAARNVPSIGGATSAYYGFSMPLPLGLRTDSRMRFSFGVLDSPNSGDVLSNATIVISTKNGFDE